MLKPFHRPRLWWGLWLLAVTGVVVLSLVNLSGLPPVPEGGDKVEHFLAYALLSASAMQLFATRRGCVVVAALLIALFGFVSSAAMAKFLLRGEVIE